jgi:cytochrome c biogenesis protein CcdA
MEFSIILIFACFIAGMLTVFAPCIFTFLPIVLGSSNSGAKPNYSKALTIILSLAVSVFIFSLLLRATTAFIQIPQSFWKIIAGLIISFQGLIILFPIIWDRLSFKLGLYKSSGLINKTEKVGGRLGDILTGAALGPIFSSCSPTYGFLIGALLQSTFSFAIIYLMVYIAGLSFLLFLIAILGQKLVDKMKWGLNPHGGFKRAIAVIFIIVGLMIMTGFHKTVETYIIENLPFLDLTRIDSSLLKSAI